MLINWLIINGIVNILIVFVLRLTNEIPNKLEIFLMVYFVFCFLLTIILVISSLISSIKIQEKTSVNKIKLILGMLTNISYLIIYIRFVMFAYGNM